MAQYQICRTCYQRKALCEFDMSSKMRNGRTQQCRECTLSSMRERGVMESYTNGDTPMRSRPPMSSRDNYKSVLEERQKEGLKHKRINQARKEYYANKRKERIKSFMEQYGEKKGLKYGKLLNWQ